MKKHTLRMLVNAFIALAVPAAWLYMMFSRKDGAFSATGLRSLRYFTVLSNLLEGAASVFFLIAGANKRLRPAADRLKYVAANAVLLTFFTVAMLLAPLYGPHGMFREHNLWFHLLIPLIAGAEFLLLNDEPVTARDSLMAVTPVVLYGTVYTAVNLASGAPYPFDLYRFLQWGVWAGLGVFLLLLGASFLIALGLRKGNQAICRRSARS